MMLLCARGFDGKMRIGILPISTFCSGHTFFIQRMAAALGLEPYVVHATFQFSGTPGKRHRFREALMWVMVSPQPLAPPWQPLLQLVHAFQPDVVHGHATFGIPGKSNTRHRFKEAFMWAVVRCNLC